MQIPKRRQILLVRDGFVPVRRIRPPLRIRREPGTDYLVLVTGARPGSRSCRVLCLARNIPEEGKGGLYWIKPDDEWNTNLYGQRVELVGKSDLPLYIGWEHGSSFGRVLKGEL